MTEVESDDQDNCFPLVMAMKFSSHEHIKEALESSTRWKSKQESKTLFELFNGIVFHTVFDSCQFDPFSK